MPKDFAHLRLGELRKVYKYDKKKIYHTLPYHYFYVTRNNCNGHVCQGRTTKNSISSKKLGMTATYTSTPRSPKHCSYTNQKIEKHLFKSDSGTFIK